MKRRPVEVREVRWFYHSGIPEELPEAFKVKPLIAAPPAQMAIQQLAGTFKIEFKTTKCIPNHVVTLRTEVNGWDRDIHGIFASEKWTFTLEKAIYPNGLVFKFLADGRHWSQGANITLGAPNDAFFTDAQVQFNQLENRYEHYYDNLESGDSDEAQSFMHFNHDESVVYDLIVIGGGMIGGVLALKAAQASLKVLVLDAGRLEYPTHTFNLPNNEGDTVRSQHEVINYVRHDNQTEIIAYPTMNLGGRSVFWSGIIPRMKSWESQHWPSAIVSELDSKWYSVAEELMRKHITTGSFQEGVIATLKPLFPNHEICDTPRAEHQPDIGQTSFIEQSTGMFSTAELLYDALTTPGDLGRDNLFVNLNHLVTRLESSNGTITKVICQDLVGNKERAYQAKRYVLAAGSIESPRIALRSGLTNPNNKTGVGLTDHGSWFSKRFVIPPGSPYAGKDKFARIFFYADPNAVHRFNTEIELNDDYWRVRHSNIAAWQDYLANKNETYIKIKCTCATPLIDSNFVQLNANPDDKVRVKMPRCPFGLETRPTVEQLVGKILTFFGVQGFDLTDNSQLGFGNQGTPHHAGGTMRVSDNQTGIVNTDLKHENYDNLYICDQSVAPFIAAANPSLTLVALGLRLAKHLASLP